MQALAELVDIVVAPLELVDTAAAEAAAVPDTAEAVRPAQAARIAVAVVAVVAAEAEPDAAVEGAPDGSAEQELRVRDDRVASWRSRAANARCSDCPRLRKDHHHSNRLHNIDRRHRRLHPELASVIRGRRRHHLLI